MSLQPQDHGHSDAAGKGSAPDLYAELTDGVATIWLNRAAKYNALTKQMWATLAQLVAQVDCHSDARVLILRSTDTRAFSTGADISEFQSVRATKEDGAAYDAVVASATRALTHARVPTIASIRGFCMGGGCELAAACDLRLADSTAVFAITPARLGVVYPLWSTKMIVDLIGPARTKMMLFTGRHLSANEAHSYGLVDEVWDPPLLDERCRDLASTIAAQSKHSVEATKRVVRAICQGSIDETEEITAARLNAYESCEYRERVKAFLERRGLQGRWEDHIDNKKP